MKNSGTQKPKTKHFIKYENQRISRGTKQLSRKYKNFLRPLVR